MSKVQAKGIRDRGYYGNPTKQFKPGELVDFLVQQHDAKRAGPHKDIRFGDKTRGMHSWATKKELPEAGGLIAIHHQPVHSHSYNKFEGTIGPGYGAGTVKKVVDGKILITKTNPDEIHFTTADKQDSTRYAVIRTGNDDYEWLLTRPNNISSTGAEKLKQKNIEPSDIDKVLHHLRTTDSVSPKIDGALNFIQLRKNQPEIVSHRHSKRTGTPIIHTERFFGYRPEIKDLPKDMKDSVLLSEVYGVSRGKVIPAQALGGILNSTIENSLKAQKDKGIDLQAMVFDIAQKGDEKIDPEVTPYSDRVKMIEEILKHLPEGKFHLPESVKGTEASRKLLTSIGRGQHKHTREGIVVTPELGQSSKIKLTGEADVYVRDIFPGQGKYSNIGAGGFKYSLTPHGKVVGKVGTGISDELRKQMFKNQEDYIGRVARIRSQGQYKETGAFRAPALLSLHEDY